MRTFAFSGKEESKFMRLLRIYEMDDPQKLCGLIIIEHLSHSKSTLVLLGIL